MVPAVGLVAACGCLGTTCCICHSSSHHQLAIPPSPLPTCLLLLSYKDGATAAHQHPFTPFVSIVFIVFSWRPFSQRYDLILERNFLREHGLEGPSFLTNIMGGEGSSKMSEEEKTEKLKEFSPVYRMRGETFFHRLSATSLLPPVNLLHGTADNTVR